nr:MFS transporter [Microbacterium sp. R1]
MTIVAVAVIASTVPIIPGRWETGTRERLALLRRPAVMAGVGSSVLGATSGLMPYIFIAPILGDISMLSRELVPSAIAILGLSGALGTAIGGRLNDRWGTDRTFLLLALVAGAIAILAWIGVGFDGSTPLWLLAGVIMLWGGASWGYNPPMNARALRFAGAAGTEAIALNTSGLYAGIAAAGAIGGVALSFVGGAATLLAAAIIGVVNLVFTVIVVRRFPSSPHIPRIQDDVKLKEVHREEDRRARLDGLSWSSGTFGHPPVPATVRDRGAQRGTQSRPSPGAGARVQSLAPGSRS